MDPFGLVTGVVALIRFALQHVIVALGMIDKTVTDDEAADESKELQEVVEELQAQATYIRRTMKVLASSTKDSGFRGRFEWFTIIRVPSLTSSSEDSQAAVAELCIAPHETFVASNDRRNDRRND